MATGCNLDDSSYGRFSEPDPFGISLCMQGTATAVSWELQISVLMFAGHEAVIHIEMYALSE